MCAGSCFRNADWIPYISKYVVFFKNLRYYCYEYIQKIWYWPGIVAF